MIMLVKTMEIFSESKNVQKYIENQCCNILPTLKLLVDTGEAGII